MRWRIGWRRVAHNNPQCLHRRNGGGGPRKRWKGHKEAVVREKDSYNRFFI